MQYCCWVFLYSNIISSFIILFCKICMHQKYKVCYTCKMKHLLHLKLVLIWKGFQTQRRHLRPGTKLVDTWLWGRSPEHWTCSSLSFCLWHGTLCYIKNACCQFLQLYFLSIWFIVAFQSSVKFVNPPGVQNMKTMNTVIGNIGFSFLQCTSS